MRWWFLLLIGVACAEPPPSLGAPDEEICLVRRDGVTPLCIDTYEAARKDATASSAGADEMSGPISREDVLPWANITWAEAKSACVLKGKRLCEREEWLDACDGQSGEDVGTQYTYGDALVAGRCNTEGGGVAGTGRSTDCTSSIGTFDQSGNLREWSGNTSGAASARGGSWQSSQTHACTSGDAERIIDPTERSSEVGFRCCRDQ